MKKLRLLIFMVITTSLLMACDDGGGSGSGSEHADIKKAKQLVTAFEKTNIISKGYIREQNTYDVNRTMQTYGAQTANTFYQMHEIGCILSDGKTELAIGKAINTASLVVGVLTTGKKDQVTYVQTNKQDNCYFAGASISGGFGWNQSSSKRWNWGQIPNCQTLVTDTALRRINKDQIGSMGYSSLQPHQQYSHGMDPYYPNQHMDYWQNPGRNPHHQYPHHSNSTEDSYFAISKFAPLSYFGPANNDRFATISNGRAVFVSETIASQSSAIGGTCAKTVYFGRPMGINTPVISSNIIIQQISN